MPLSRYAFDILNTLDLYWCHRLWLLFKAETILLMIYRSCKLCIDPQQKVGPCPIFKLTFPILQNARGRRGGLLAAPAMEPGPPSRFEARLWVACPQSEGGGQDWGETEGGGEATGGKNSEEVAKKDGGTSGGSFFFWRGWERLIQWASGGGCDTGKEKRK